jgi:threonine dehydrogenase-like Zn-dependent dehydrogenase
MMKAARFHARADIRVEDVPKPIPKENEVLVEIEWCGTHFNPAFITTHISKI